MKKTTDNKLSFDELRLINVQRCEESFRPLEAWDLFRWQNAVTGEWGEACNVLKKMDRAMEQLGDGAITLQDLADELADTITYIDLFAARAGIDLGAAVRRKFNIVSERVKSERRL